MGTTKLNEILGIHLGVHDVEDAYDICKGRDKTFYLRVKHDQQGFVSALENSHKHAGDEILCVSGNWEFSPGSSRAYKVPLFLWVAPSKHCSLILSFSFLFYFNPLVCRTDHLRCRVEKEERKKLAWRDGWRKNPVEHRLVKDYLGHENRAAWKLLDYEPNTAAIIRGPKRAARNNNPKW